MWTTQHGRLLHPEATVLQVDHEAEAIGAHHRVDVGVAGDAAETASALLAEMEARPAARCWRTPELARRIRAGGWRDEPYEDAGTGAQGHPLDLVRFPDTDLAALARGAGLEGVTVRRRDDLAGVGRWLDCGPHPSLLVDAKVVPTVVAGWLEEAFQGH